jgi:hypothetical protein
LAFLRHRHQCNRRTETWIRPIEHELGLHVCGGRGKHSRNTPDELVSIGDRIGFDGAALATASRLVAQVDSAASERPNGAIRGPFESKEQAIENALQNLRDAASDERGESTVEEEMMMEGLLRSNHYRTLN